MENKREALRLLIEKYTSYKEQGRLDLSSEETIRTWINELLFIFDWDVKDTSQILQEKMLSKEEKNKLKNIDSTNVRPDYTFKMGNQKLTFLDAKSVSVNIKTSTSSAFQIKSYGWSILAPCSFVTNFEEFAIYDCTYVPNQKQHVNLGRIYLKIDEYVEHYELLEKHLLKSNILNGSLSKLYSNTLKIKKGIQKLTPDFVFAEQLSVFRLSLASNIVEKNPKLLGTNSELLAYLTQVIINRIIFIRICEARKIEKDSLLLDFQENGFWKQFKNSSYNEFFEHYDGPLFDRIDILETLEVSNKVIKELIDLLYYPSPYRFDVIPTKLLSDIYEIFLSKKLLIKNGKVSEELKLEYIKTNGAVTTPQYLVQDLLKRTIVSEKLIANGLDGIFNSKILDFACGSGIFLIEIFDYLQDILISYYDKNPLKELRHLFFQNDDFTTLTIEGKRHLIRSCIFGVDIDPEAVEVSRMSLSLKVIDSSDFYENYQELGIFGNQILNNIGTNIKCGNTLVSTDIYEKYPLIASDKEQLFKTNAFDYNSKEGFLDVFDINGGFDYIVGNPPYVEVKNYNIEYPFMHQYIKENYETTKIGKVDLSIAFIEKAISILNSEGKLGLIVQNRFFRANYGKNLRNFINTNNLLSQVINFKSTNIFKNRITYIALMILDKNQPKMIYCHNITSDALDIPLKLKSLPIVETDNSCYTKVQTDELDPKLWQLVDPEVLTINNILLKKHTCFGDFAKVRGGIQALWNKAYHISIKSINSDGTITGSSHIEEDITIEIDACRPLITNKSFFPFCDDSTDTYVIFPYDVIDEEKIEISFLQYNKRFPLAGAYLSRSKAVIKENVQTNLDDRWHLFTRENSHERTFSKVLLPMTANDTYATVTCNPKNYCDNANMYFIDIPKKTDINLYAVTGIINSTLFSVLARPIANPQSGGYFKFNKQFIEPIPFPKENFNKNRVLVLEISKLSQDIEKYQYEYKSSSPRQKSIFKTILTGLWDNLDSKVYELYDLSNEEVIFFNQRGRNINRLELLN